MKKVQQLGCPALGLAFSDAVVSGVDEQVVYDCKVHVQVVFLGDDPYARLDLSCVSRYIQAEDGEGPFRDRQVIRDHSHGGGLPRPVGAQEPETLTPVDGKGYAVNCCKITELFCKIGGVEDYV